MENIDKDANEIQRLLLAEVKALFPEWPEPKSVKCQKWRYSQVFEFAAHIVCDVIN
jgi:renalase